MTWRHPEKIPKAGQVIDYKDLNAGFRPFVEADGKLGEGNFSDTLATTLDTSADLATDIAYRSDSARATSYAGGPVASATNEIQIRVGPGWTAVDGGGSGALRKTFQVETGPVILLASFQAGRLEPGDGDASTPDAFFMHPQFAFRVNGSLIETSVVGDQDFSKEGEGMELGPWNYLHGVDMFYILDIGPGRHTVEVVAHAEGDPTSLASAEEAILIYNRELVVVEVK